MFKKKESHTHTEAATEPDERNGGRPWDALVRIGKVLFDKNEKDLKRLQPILHRINSFDFSSATDEELKAKSEELKQRLRDSLAKQLRERGFDPDRQVDEWLADPADDEYLKTRRNAEESTLNDLLPEAFALVREVAARTIQLRPFDVQCLGGIVLHQGKIAEMKTGEGKTLTATMPVYLNALTGRGVHVVTVNDYLAERDANWMRPIYEFLGLKVAYISNSTPLVERRAAYRADVLYITNSEVGFDYLRDNMATNRNYLVQRPLNYAIVDEVDNILIDEARTPLIISAQVELSDRARKRRALAKLCDVVARKLVVVPAVTEPEVQKVIDRHTHDNRISIDGLMDFLRHQGCMEAGLSYMIDCYLASESSARAYHAGKLVDTLEEARTRQLIEAESLKPLLNLMDEPVTGTVLRERILDESERMFTPYMNAAFGIQDSLRSLEAWDNAETRSFIETLEQMGLLRDEAVGELETALDRTSDIDQVRQLVFLALIREMEKKNLIDPEGARQLLVAIVEDADADRVRLLLRDTILPASPLCSQALAIADAFDQWLSSAGTQSEEGPPDKRAIARRVTEIIEHIGVQQLLPPDAVERMWELVRIKPAREVLHRGILSAAREHPGVELHRIVQLAATFAAERDEWLKTSSEQLAQSLQAIQGLPKIAHSTVVQRARAGDSEEALRAALHSELMKISPNSDVLKVVRNYLMEQARHAEDTGNSVLREMSEWVEISKELRKSLLNSFIEYTEPNALKERLTELVRDLPGETVEIPSIINETASKIAHWNQSHADAVIDAIASAASLPSSSLNRLTTLLEQGVSGQQLEEAVVEELLHLPLNESAMQCVLAHTEAWDAWRQQKGEQFLADLGDIGSEDLVEKIRSLIGAPVPAAELPQRVVDLVIHDVIGRNLEPLLAPENAQAFHDEVRRRVPLSKEVLGKMRPEHFAGKNKEQLLTHIFRLVHETLGTIPVDSVSQGINLPHVLKTLGWYVEKDEKQRASALTDMGALIAEREIGSPAFMDPDNFLDVLVENGVLREDEVQDLHMRLASKHLSASRSGEPDRGPVHVNWSQLIAENLQLDPARRRRVSELKMGEIASILDQSIKAHSLFHRDVHYVVQEGREIVIVDEFTGRLMPGRRWSDGLHEAVEAKHGVEVRLESQTVATITIQNYFRMYYKLAGMTGTAKTEESEFANTYKLEVICIPTNKPVRRTDYPDVVYKTAEAKFRSIVLELLQMHWRGQPVLVGTRSVEVSERLSDRLKGPSLQLLTLTVLIKTRLWEMEKSINAKERDAIIAQLNVPFHQLNVTQVRNFAKQFGIPIDVTCKENVDKLENMFENGPGNRDRLITALRNGIPHNVLNAKNHRNEARIIAEAARVGAITIATNMAGRGVDIVLGGTLDEEARIRVITGQILARRARGEFARVRSRTDESTAKMCRRLTPDSLQDLCWCLTVEDAVNELHRERKIDSFQAKEMRDVLSVSLDTNELRNRVRSRARRLNCAESLPLQDDVLSEDRIRIFARRVNIHESALDVLRDALAKGVASYVHASDAPERVLIRTLLELLNGEKQWYQQLLLALPQLEDLDHLLLETVAESDYDLRDANGIARTRDAMHSHLGAEIISEEWIRHRLEAFDVVDASTARVKLGSLAPDEIEINDQQLLNRVRTNGAGNTEAAALFTESISITWIHDRLKKLGVVRSERRYANGPGTGNPADGSVTHFRIDRTALSQLSFAPDRFEGHIRADWIVERLKALDPQAPWATFEWVNDRLWEMQILQGPQAAVPVTVLSEQDDSGAISRETLLYRINGLRLVDHMEQSFMETLIQELGEKAELETSIDSIMQSFVTRHPFLADWLKSDWIVKRLTDLHLGDASVMKSGGKFRIERRYLPTVLIESGVFGQAADWVLVGEKRPEDVIQTSEYHEVKSLGGLHVLGTERHESRRIDNQLRGRSGRQGDPGTSRFYVSWEDELIRLFASPPRFILDRWYEDEAIAAKLVTKSIERAQKKVEINHFEARKHTLQYDDVMNIQRDVIYKERRKALLGGNLRARAMEMVEKCVTAEVHRHANPQLPPSDWDLRRLYQSLTRLLGVCRLSDYIGPESLERKSYQEVLHLCTDAFRRAYEDREADVSPELMRELERFRVCEAIDEYWMQHLAEMDSLREGINLRAYGQREPLLEYRREAYELFGNMMESIERDVTEYLFGVRTEDVRAWAEQVRSHQLRLRAMQMRRGEDEAAGATSLETFEHEVRKVGRNEPCPCGSGKKYKKCCMLKQQAA